MDATSRMYYAFGQVLYAIAKVDGKVQSEERDKVHNIVTEGLKNHSADLDVTEIIFNLLETESMGSESVYEWAIKEMDLVDYKLTPEIKSDFVNVVEAIAAAFPPITPEENELIQRFKADLEKL